jgi:hypothetical protein
MKTNLKANTKFFFSDGDRSIFAFEHQRGSYWPTETSDVLT